MDASVFLANHYLHLGIKIAPEVILPRLYLINFKYNKKETSEVAQSSDRPGSNMYDSNVPFY